MRTTALFLLFLLHICTGYAQSSDSISYRDVYNFDVGDEFHIFEEHPYQTRRSKLKVLSIDSTSIADTIKYKYERKVHVVTRNFSTITNYFEDQIYIKYNYTNFFVEQPINDTCITDSVGTEICTYDTTNINTGVGVNGRKGHQKTMFKHYKYTNGNIRTVRTIDIAVIGLGMLKSNYYTFSTTSSMQKQVIELVYYKKGAETWGTPINFNTGINDKSNINTDKLVVYPNPTYGSLTIQLPEEEKINTISIYSVQGQLIKSDAIGNQSIDISELPKGIYLLEATLDNDITLRKKIIKQ